MRDEERQRSQRRRPKADGFLLLRHRHGMLCALAFLVCSGDKRVNSFLSPYSYSSLSADRSNSIRENSCAMLKQSSSMKINFVAQDMVFRSTTSLRDQSSSSSFKSLKEFNTKLEKMADKCGSLNEPVIVRAAEVQELWEMQKNRAKGDDGDVNFKPDVNSFRSALTAWSQCTSTLVRSRRNERRLPSSKTTVDVYTPLDAAKRATSLLLAYPEPDLEAYNIVMDAWSKSRVHESPDASERLLRRMRDDETIQPNTLTYNLLIDTWANSNRENSLVKVLQIYRHMERLGEDGENDVSPSIRTINAVLHAHARKSAHYTSQNTQEGYDQAAQCASDALSLLEDTKKRYQETGDVNWQPDTATYTTVMDVHSRCASYKKTKIAAELLEELKQLHFETKSYKYKPNFRTYTALVTAWSRTKSEDSPRQVEAIMKEMTERGEKPNSRTYTAAIQCWSRARNPLKAKRVLELIMRMRKENIRPTTVTFNNAIDACARCQGDPDQKTESLKIAFALLKTVEIDKVIKPDGMTYSTLIRASNFLMPSGDERNKIAMMVFEKAKKAGLVEVGTLSNIRLAVDASTFQTALEGKLDQNGNFDYSSLPYDWKKNIRN